MFEASPVAGDDRPLLAGEHAQRFLRHPPGLELGEVAMLGEAAFDRCELGQHDRQQLSGLHTG
jgi:hypothetical protein